MIAVDTSVWVSHLRGVMTGQVTTLRSLFGQEPLLIGDIVLLEILQGAQDDRHAARIERDLRRFPIAHMLGDDIAASAARNYRLLRGRGVSIRKTADLIIGTYCIEHDHTLLHDDRDFEPMIHHLGLRAL